MARPYKARRICSVPAIDTFGPLNQEMDSAVELTLEEYETIRLIDWLDCTQEQCADQMGVARTTVQAVYNSARKKLADCLVNGKRAGNPGRQLPAVSGRRKLLREELRKTRVPQTPL